MKTGLGAKLEFYKKKILEKYKEGEVGYIEIAVYLDKYPSEASKICRMLAIKYPETFEYEDGILKVKGEK